MNNIDLTDEVEISPVDGFVGVNNLNDRQYRTINRLWKNRLGQSVSDCYLLLKSTIESMPKFDTYFVYFLLGDVGDILYIGYSGNIRKRLIQHRRRKTFSVVVLYEYENSSDATGAESDCIRYYSPLFNEKSIDHRLLNQYSKL